MDKIEQNLENHIEGSRSEPGERAPLAEHGKSLAERLREERASGELARKSEARINEIVDDPHNGSQSCPLDMGGLLERKHELDQQSVPHRAEVMNQAKSLAERLREERASGELGRKSEAHVKKQVDDVRLDREHVNGSLERQRIVDQKNV